MGIWILSICDVKVYLGICPLKSAGFDKPCKAKLKVEKLGSYDGQPDTIIHTYFAFKMFST